MTPQVEGPGPGRGFLPASLDQQDFYCLPAGLCITGEEKAQLKTSFRVRRPIAGSFLGGPVLIVGR